MTVVELARTRIGTARRRVLGGRAPLNTSAWLVLASSGILLAFGLVMILSASSVSALQRYGSSFFFLKRQVLWAAIGLAIAVVVSRIDYRKWRVIGWLMLLVSFVGLILVLHPAFGVRVSGSSRWLGAGPLRIQPSELAKLALLLVAADVITRKQKRLHSVREIMLPLGFIAILLAALVMLQPDLGTTLILGMILLSMLYVGGAPLPVLTGMGALGLAAGAGLALTEGYRKLRILSFVDPFRDPLNSGYQAVQSMIALGSGGFFGVGLGASRQKWLYVPNAHTDFIFSIIGEELGLVGTFLVVGLFVLLAYAGVRVARRAPDPFGRLVAAGVTTWILGQAVINMGAVTGLLPITGVPLPLVSFGGSALVFTLAGIGILANIARQEMWPPPVSAPPSAPKPARRRR
jgi:cell division protein FtsW